ncbi:MAG: GFA family protein [Phreatobacter sp.]
MSVPVTGGCQCGAVRFACDGLGRASICHCRMCQKAFGGYFGPLVSPVGLRWTRGVPKRFKSSNKVSRGFCADCGTPLTYEYPGGVELALGAFDHPEAIVPVIQMGLESRVPFFADLPGLPTRTPAEQAKVDAFLASIVSFQHPDHDTDDWPPAGHAP